MSAHGTQESQRDLPTGRSTTGARPVPVALAAGGLLVLVALSFVGILGAATSRPQLVAAIQRTSPTLTESQVDTAATVSVAMTVAVALAFAVLLTWLAVKVWQGRNWARITVTVLLVLGFLSDVYSLSQPSGTLNRAVTVIQLVVSAAVVLLLWLPAAARGYFRRTTA